jgi:hypothetical protein
MIASYSRNFIFIKTRKTAGTSVEIVLSSWCDRRDICTPINAEDEIARLQQGGLPSNFATDPSAEQRYRDAIRSKDLPTITQRYRGLNKRFFNHMSASEIRSLLPDLWGTAFKFTVERHPYERAISRVYWNISRARGHPKDFDRHLDEALDRAELPNYPLYTEQGNLILDKVVRYEILWQEIAEIAANTGVQLPVVLPRAKSAHRSDQRSAHDILSRSQKQRIAVQCAPEFELMGYKY